MQQIQHQQTKNRTGTLCVVPIVLLTNPLLNHDTYTVPRSCCRCAGDGRLPMRRITPAPSMSDAAMGPSDESVAISPGETCSAATCDPMTAPSTTGTHSAVTADLTSKAAALKEKAAAAKAAAQAAKAKAAAARAVVAALKAPKPVTDDTPTHAQDCAGGATPAVTPSAAAPVRAPASGAEDVVMSDADAAAFPTEHDGHTASSGSAIDASCADDDDTDHHLHRRVIQRRYGESDGHGDGDRRDGGSWPRGGSRSRGGERGGGAAV